MIITIPSNFSVLRTPDFVLISGPSGDLVMKREMIAIIPNVGNESYIETNRMGLYVALSVIS